VANGAELALMCYVNKLSCQSKFSLLQKVLFSLLTSYVRHDKPVILA